MYSYHNEFHMNLHKSTIRVSNILPSEYITWRFPTNNTELLFSLLINHIKCGISL